MRTATTPGFFAETTLFAAGKLTRQVVYRLVYITKRKVFNRPFHSIFSAANTVGTTTTPIALGL
jgi:hypothetical protein